MVSLLEGSLADIAFKALGPQLYDVTFIKVTKVSDGSGGFTETDTSHSAKGFVDEFSEFYRTQAMVPSGDVKVLLLQKSFVAVPKIDDKVTARTVTYRVINVSQDPAQATWELQCRPWR